MTIERFKTDDGREGSMAPIGNGLVKLLFDDGEMVIVTESKPRSEPMPIRPPKKTASKDCSSEVAPTPTSALPSGVVSKSKETPVDLEYKKDDVLQYLDHQRVAMAKECLESLKPRIAELNQKIVDCQQNLSQEQSRLDRLLMGEKERKITDKSYLKAAKEAYSAGIKAWDLSIKAFQKDVDQRQSAVDTIINEMPADLLRYLEDGQEIPAHPLVSVKDIPDIVEKLGQGKGYPRFAVLLVDDDADAEFFVVLQYSVENNIVGFDWLLNHERNVTDRDAITAFAKDLGYEFSECDMDGTRYLRVEGSELASLGVSILRKYYKNASTVKIRLLVQGFHWKAKPTAAKPVQK